MNSLPNLWHSNSFGFWLAGESSLPNFLAVYPLLLLNLPWWWLICRVRLSIKTCNIFLPALPAFNYTLNHIPTSHSRKNSVKNVWVILVKHDRLLSQSCYDLRNMKVPEGCVIITYISVQIVINLKCSYCNVVGLYQVKVMLVMIICSIITCWCYYCHENSKQQTYHYPIVQDKTKQKTNNPVKNRPDISAFITSREWLSSPDRENSKRGRQGLAEQAERTPGYCCCWCCWG